MSTNIPTEVAGENINQDQKTWLEGFFTGFKEKGLTFSDASENSKKTPKQKKLIPEEKIKKNKNPFNAFSNLVNLAKKISHQKKTMCFALNGTVYFG